MKITLDRLRAENFKGQKTFEMVLEGRNAIIRAENGVGKTTVYDMVLWLLFGKNSEGVSKFGVVPYDANNKAIRGVVVCVEAYLGIDDKTVVIKKEMHEKIVKKQLTGYSCYYWINDVPKKESEFVEYIKTKLVAEDIFKMLTDLTYFNGKLGWKERRAFLMELAGKVKVKGHKKLLDLVGPDRTLDEYKDILRGQKKLYDAERKEINPRIDELQKGLEEYASGDDTTKGAETRRNELNADIGKLEEQRKELIDGENERQTKISYMNTLKGNQSDREAELKNDTSCVKELLDEKEAIGVKVLEASQEVTRLEGVCSELKATLSLHKTSLERRTKSRNTLSEEKKQVNSAPLDSKCYACRQELPDELKEKVQQERNDKLAEIDEQGKKLFAVIKADRTSIEKIEAEIAEATDTHTLTVSDYKRLADEKDVRWAELDVKINNKPRPIPEKDNAWAALAKEIFELGKEIGKPPADQLAEIESKRTELNDELETLNKTLANADTITKNTLRIAELGDREKELGQKIADVEALLSEIDEYKKSESEMIESAVNDKFEHTTFKLFDYRLNGEINPTCIATYEGIGYGDMSAGEKIRVGIDIVNVLSEHYGISVVLFIDESEGLTFSVEAKSQVIELKAVKSYMEHQPQPDGTVKEVWHDYTKLVVEIEEPERE